MDFICSRSKYRTGQQFFVLNETQEMKWLSNNTKASRLLKQKLREYWETFFRPMANVAKKSTAVPTQETSNPRLPYLILSKKNTTSVYYCVISVLQLVLLQQHNGNFSCYIEILSILTVRFNIFRSSRAKISTYVCPGYHVITQIT